MVTHHRECCALRAWAWVLQVVQKVCLCVLACLHLHWFACTQNRYEPKTCGEAMHKFLPLLLLLVPVGPDFACLRNFLFLLWESFWLVLR